MPHWRGISDESTLLGGAGQHDKRTEAKFGIPATAFGCATGRLNAALSSLPGTGNAGTA